MTKVDFGEYGGDILNAIIETILNDFVAINKHLSKKKYVKDKGEGDITYAFDIEVEKLLYEGIKKRYGEIRVMGEESIYENHNPREFIMLDPIDGSTNAARGLPFFGTMIAHFKGNSLNDIINAVVWDIPSRRLIFATKGKGAYVFEDQKIKTLKITDIKSFSRHEILYDISPHSPIEVLVRMKKFGKFRHLGSLGMSVCFVAEQRLDIAGDLSGRARLVDVIAPLFILKEVGGTYIYEVNGPVKPETKIVYLASWNKNLLEKVIRETWGLRKKFY